MPGNDYDRILGFIAETYANGGGIDETTELVRSEIIDSYGIIDMIDFLEETFAIDFPDEDIAPENFRTVTAIADCVARIRATT